MRWGGDGDLGVACPLVEETGSGEHDPPAVGLGSVHRRSWALAAPGHSPSPLPGPAQVLGRSAEVEKLMLPTPPGGPAVAWAPPDEGSGGTCETPPPLESCLVSVPCGRLSSGTWEVWCCELTWISGKAGPRPRLLHLLGFFLSCHRPGGGARWRLCSHARPWPGSRWLSLRR